VNLELYLGKIPLVVKLIAIYLLSIVSFFMTDLMVCFGIIAGGFNLIVFILYFIMRAVLADFVSNLFYGIKVSIGSKLNTGQTSAILIFGVPIISFTEVLRILFGISIKLPQLPYVSLTQSTLIMASLYEFPRLILVIIIKWFLYGKIPAEGVR